MNLPRLDKYTTINFILYINIFLFIINLIYFYAIVPAPLFQGKLDMHLIENIALYITIAGTLLIPFEIFYRKKHNIISEDFPTNKNLNFAVIFFIFINIYFFNDNNLLYWHVHPHLYFHPPKHVVISIILLFIYCTRHLPIINKYKTVNAFIITTLFVPVNFIFAFYTFIYVGCYIAELVFHHYSLCDDMLTNDFISEKLITSASFAYMILIPIEIFLNKKKIINTCNVVKFSEKRQKIILFISIIVFLFDIYLLIDYFMPHRKLD